MRATKTETGLATLTGALLGAAAMYLLDPDSGDRRRHRIGETAGGAARTAGDALGSTWDKARDASASLADRAQGWYEDLPGLKDALHDAQHAGAKHARGWRDKAAALVGEWRDAAGDAGGRAADAATDAKDRAAGGIAGAASGLRGHVDDWTSSLLDRAASSSHSARHRLARAIDPDHVRGPGHAVGWSSAMVGTLALGAGLMYLFDPARGPARRSWLAGHASDTLKDVGTLARRTGRDVMSRVRGTAPDARGSSTGSRAAGPDADTDSEQLLQRIRAGLGRVLSYPAQVQLMCDAQGSVTVYGRVPNSEADQLVSTIRNTPGVRQVNNRAESVSLADLAPTSSSAPVVGQPAPQM